MSPLPLLLAGAAALFLLSKGEDEEDETTPTPTPDPNKDEKQESDDTPKEEEEKKEEIEKQDEQDDDEEIPPPPPDTSASGYSNVTRDEMRVIQSRLNTLDYYNDDIDGLYGSNTKAATSAFQKAYGLSIDGKPGPNTQAALALAVAGQLEPKKPSGTGTGTSSGASGYSDVTRDEMKVIQGQLTQLEYYSDDPEDNDGLYGTMTKDATTAFQKDYGLDVDGKPGPNTQDALQRAASGELQKIPDESFIEEEEDVDINEVFDPVIKPSTGYAEGTIRALTWPKYNNDWQPKVMVAKLNATGRWEWRAWVDYKTGEKSMSGRGTSSTENGAIAAAKSAVDDWVDRSPVWRAKLNRTVAGASYDETQEPGNPGIDYWNYTGQMTYDNRWAWAVRKMDTAGSTPRIVKGWAGEADTLADAINSTIIITSDDMGPGARETEDNTRLNGVIYSETYKKEVKSVPGHTGYQTVSEYAEKVPLVNIDGDVVPVTVGWRWIVRLGMGLYPAWVANSSKTLTGNATSKFQAQTKIDDAIKLRTGQIDAPAPTPTEPDWRETTRLSCDGSKTKVYPGLGREGEVRHDDPNIAFDTHVYDYSWGKRYEDDRWAWRVVEYEIVYGLYRKRKSCSMGDAFDEFKAELQAQYTINTKIGDLPSS